MPATLVGDIIIPEVFNPYVVQRTAELSNLVKSGIIVPNSELDALAKAGGKLINMPFFNDLSGSDEILDDENPLSVNNIDTGQDVAALFMRGKAWGVNDLAKALSGADPMKVIGDLVAEYWARRQQALLVSILTGVFANNAAASPTGNDGDHILDISGLGAGKSHITGSAVISAAALMGDAMLGLTAMMVHSGIYAELQRQNLIDFTPTNTQNIGFGTYLNKTLIVDDGCPESGGNYTTYLFGRGAIGYGEGNPPVPTETDRDSLAGEDILVNRRHFVLHPRGIAFQNSTIEGESPSNAECEEAAQWKRVYESKNIRLVALISKAVEETE